MWYFLFMYFSGSNYFQIMQIFRLFAVFMHISPLKGDKYL